MNRKTISLLSALSKGWRLLPLIAIGITVSQALVLGASSEEIVFGVGESFEKQLKIKSDPNHGIYYLSCIYMHLRLSQALLKEVITEKDRLSDAEGGCLAALTLDLKKPEEVENIRKDPEQAGCIGAFRVSFNRYGGAAQGKAYEQIKLLLGKICLK